MFHETDNLNFEEYRRGGESPSLGKQQDLPIQSMHCNFRFNKIPVTYRFPEYEVSRDQNLLIRLGHQERLVPKFRDLSYLNHA